MSYKLVTRARIGVLTVLGLSAVLSAGAQSPPSGGSAGGAGAPSGDGPSPAQQAIKSRQAVYTLIAGSFGPLGRVLQGKAQFDGPEAVRRAERVAFLATFLPEAFPDFSKDGNTQARPEIWTNRADFDKRVKEFTDHSNALVQVLHQNPGNSDAFKAAVTAIGGDCKGCHDNYRTR